jgi:uncharacterized protein (DUF983 family)
MEPLNFGMQLSIRRVALLFWRALRRRCPNCGGGGLFATWLKFNQRCPTCGLALERGEDGYQVGSYMFNIIASELVFAAIFITVLVAAWPSPPWDLLLWGGSALMLVAPFGLYPFTKTVFLAFDLVFRPATQDELTIALTPDR